MINGQIYLEKIRPQKQLYKIQFEINNVPKDWSVGLVEHAGTSQLRKIDVVNSGFGTWRGELTVQINDIFQIYAGSRDVPLHINSFMVVWTGGLFQNVHIEYNTHNPPIPFVYTDAESLW